MSAAGGALPGLVALTGAYVLSQFFRVALAAVAPEVARDLGLPPGRLGALSAVWFIAFAAAQLPVGIALDRWGPRRTVSLLFLAAALGCGIMAMAGSLATALAGQALIGVGCAPVFMGTLVVLARFYDRARFASATSLVLATGSAGTILGATPLALVAAAIGWRGAFVGMAGLVGLIAGLTAVLVRDRPLGAPRARQGGTLGAELRGVASVAMNRRLWAILPMSFTGYAVLVTVRGLWAGPFLDDVFALSIVARGQVLLAMSLAMIAGTLLYARLERALDRRREPVLAGSAVAAASLLGLAAFGTRSLTAGVALLVVLGLAGMTYALLMAQGRRFLADTEVGRGLTLLNAACFAGAAAFQAGSGILLDRTASWTAPARYALLFTTLAGLLTAALLSYSRSRDQRAARDDRGKASP